VLTIVGSIVRLHPVAGGRFTAVNALFNVCRKVGAVVAALETVAAIVLAAVWDDDVTEKETTTPPCNKCRPPGVAETTEVMVMALFGTLRKMARAVTKAVRAAWVNVATE
jgi:hypothetical protein